MNKVSSRRRRFIGRQTDLLGRLLVAYAMQAICIIALAAQTADPAAFEVV
jgi:hypothetical protein